MLYLERLKYSAAASVLVHVVVLVSAGYQVSSNSIGVTPKSDPIVLNLTPRVEREQIVEEEERQRELNRLIDPGAPTDSPVDETDMISSEDSKAQSAKTSAGDPDRPSVDRIDDFDEMPRQPTPQPPVQTALVPPQMPVERSVEPDPEPEPVLEPIPEPAEEVPDEQGAVQVAAVPREARKPEPERPVEPEPEKEPAPEAKKSEEAVQVAQAPTAPAPPPVQELRASRGREDGGAQPGGFTSFEANQHELGAYMLKVRNHVEREWRTALATRYPGVGPARALLDCSIRPDGTLDYVRIVENGNSPGFATLCKAAVERASRNFEPFPFEVPEIYRSKNLEVRWLFTYN